MELPDFLDRGETSRLFPVLSENSKEGRAISIFLACLTNIHEFAAVMMGSIGQRVGTRANLTAFTEVTFKNRENLKDRPDGLLIIEIGNRTWRALVEAKIGSEELSGDQILKYAEIAKAQNIDAIITISNQFTSQPDHHPVNLPKNKIRNIEIYHWSWMFVLTQATLLIANEEITDSDQKYILSEFIRFLTHDSTGIRSFARMPKCWAGLNANIKAGGMLRSQVSDVKEVVNAWQQEQKDLCLIMSRILSEKIHVKLTRSESNDPSTRTKNDIERFVNDHTLTTSLSIPNAAAQLEVVADAKARTLTASMKIVAAQDRVSAVARVNWLLRMLSKAKPESVFVRAYWPGRTPSTQASLEEVRREPGHICYENKKLSPSSFEVMMIRAIGGRFSKPQTFISEIEDIVPQFYKEIGQYLKNWQPPAPRVEQTKSSADDVSPDAIQARFTAQESAQKSE